MKIARWDESNALKLQLLIEILPVPLRERNQRRPRDVLLITIYRFLSIAHSSYRRERRFRWSAPNETASFLTRHWILREQLDDVVRKAVVKKLLKRPGKLPALEVALG